MGKNCGCVPCKKPIETKKKKCKPFSVCVGNYSLIWDGSCASVQERTYKIPDGTYTSLTFQGGCIVGVGNAPVPQYTPQACCGTEERIETPRNDTATNTVSLTNYWDPTAIFSVKGNGTPDRPYNPTLKLSKGVGNNLEVRSDGLYANTYFKTSDTVEVTGKGSAQEPYKFTVKGSEPKLPKVNEDEIEGNGFTILTDGRVKADGDLNLVSNLEFSDPDVFQVVNGGMKTVVNVDLDKLRGAVKVEPNAGLKGNGSVSTPISLDMDFIVDKLKELGFKQEQT